MTRDKGACHIKPIGLRAFKVAFCDLEACSSARAGRGNKMRTLAVHPVNTMYARYFAEMLGIMGDYGQPKMTSSNSYKNIEVANNNTLTCERLTNFSIIAHPVTALDAVVTDGYIGLTMKASRWMNYIGASNNLLQYCIAFVFRHNLIVPLACPLLLPSISLASSSHLRAIYDNCFFYY